MVPDSNPGQDPYEALSTWYQEAVTTEPRVPDAMQLATADASGRPSVRTVLLKTFGPTSGLVFFTNYTSRKATQLGENPYASACLNWKVIRRQVIAQGPIVKADREISETYFASRSRGSQIGAWASDQSQGLVDRNDLLERVRHYEDKFQGIDVPCPPHWGGFHLMAERFEFWQDVESRLHHRVLYVKQDGAWSRSLLQP